MREALFPVLALIGAFGILVLVVSLVKFDPQGILVGVGCLLPITLDRPEVKGFVWIISIFVLPALGATFGLNVMEELTPENNIMRVAGGFAGAGCGIWLLVLMARRRSGRSG